jgi:hypothetical protein
MSLEEVRKSFIKDKPFKKTSEDKLFDKARELEKRLKIIEKDYDKSKKDLEFSKRELERANNFIRRFIPAFPSSIKENNERHILERIKTELQKSLAQNQNHSPETKLEDRSKQEDGKQGSLDMSEISSEQTRDTNSQEIKSLASQENNHTNTPVLKAGDEGSNPSEPHNDVLDIGARCVAVKDNIKSQICKCGHKEDSHWFYYKGKRKSPCNCKMYMDNGMCPCTRFEPSEGKDD